MIGWSLNDELEGIWKDMTETCQSVYPVSRPIFKGGAKYTSEALGIEHTYFRTYLKALWTQVDVQLVTKGDISIELQIFVHRWGSRAGIGILFYGRLHIGKVPVTSMDQAVAMGPSRGLVKQAISLSPSLCLAVFIWFLTT